MSDTPSFDFSKFVPGFDFLQNLTKGAAQKLPQMPNLGGWVAPTINVEELDKRIGELKAVQFWLDQNAAALKATIQALEVQKMTLATLKGMNFNMGELAEAFKIKTPAPSAAPAGTKPAAVPEPAPAPAEAAASAEKDEAPVANGHASAAATGVVDPLQWWNSLTTQFQQIAASAMQDASKTVADGGPAANFAKEALKNAEEFAKVATQPLAQATAAVSAAARRPAPKAAAKKGAASKTSAAAKKRAG